MSTRSTPAQESGRAGGLIRAALAPDRRALTQAARDARWQGYVEKVRAAVPDATDAELQRRAEMLRQADMSRLAAKSVIARRRAAEARRAAAELAAAIGADEVVA
jgi:hypothetical protein